jgi:hypothetical protein
VICGDAGCRDHRRCAPHGGFHAHPASPGSLACAGRQTSASGTTGTAREHRLLPHDGRSTVEVDSADGRCRTRNDQKRPSRSSAGFGPLRSDPSASQEPIRAAPAARRARPAATILTPARWSGRADRPATPPAAPGTSAMGPTLSTTLGGARTPRRRAAQARVSPKERNMICQHDRWWGQHTRPHQRSTVVSPKRARESRSGPS